MLIARVTLGMLQEYPSGISSVRVSYARLVVSQG
jgi:hypothetical protein